MQVTVRLQLDRIHIENDVAVTDTERPGFIEFIAEIDIVAFPVNLARGPVETRRIVPVIADGVAREVALPGSSRDVCCTASPVVSQTGRSVIDFGNSALF